MSRAPFRIGNAEDRERRRQRILKLHSDGCTPQAIAERLGMGDAPIYVLLRAQGLKPNAFNGGDPV